MGPLLERPRKLPGKPVVIAEPYFMSSNAESRDGVWGSPESFRPRTERLEVGKKLRDELARDAHADSVPMNDRDPIGILEK